MKIILVAGARPNFMKIAPIICAIESFNQINLSREMLLNSLSHWDQTNQTNLSRLPCSESERGEMRPALWSVETTPWGAYFTGTRETRKVNELNNVPEAFQDSGTSEETIPEGQASAKASGRR
jgi:hypothetical protein